MLLDIPQMLLNYTVHPTRCLSETDVMECLRAADELALDTANAAISIGAFYGTYVFVPVVDGTFIVERPSVTLKSGHANGVSTTNLSFPPRHAYFTV